MAVFICMRPKAENASFGAGFSSEVALTEVAHSCNKLSENNVANNNPSFTTVFILNTVKLKKGGNKQINLAFILTLLSGVFIKARQAKILKFKSPVFFKNQ
ncbi:hypothetical protein [Undibacterium sp. TJN19]|uniref:hypothetical protein n=1 Tax=Undibacterium sp. TJN19 TaxID=3413055 RepID=UPI003BF42AFB